MVSKEVGEGLARGPNDVNVNFDEFLDRKMPSCFLNPGASMLDSRYESKISDTFPSMNMEVVTEREISLFNGMKSSTLPA